jgi:hypothetical protein
MATFNINAVDRRIQYTSTGQTAFNFSFQVNASSELQVYIDDTLKTETTHYSVSLNTDGTGTVTFGSATTSGEIITIIGDQPLSRTTVFQTGQTNNPTTLETEFDNVLIRQQQLKEITDRSIQLKVTTPRTVTGSGTSGPLEFPYDATTSNNADKLIAYDTNGTSLVLGPTSAGLTTLTAIASEVQTLAGISSNITTVAGIASNVTAVAGDATDIGAVAAKATEIGRLGTADAVADMALLGTSDVVADMALLGNADVIADMALLANADVIADMNTLATTDIVSDLNTLATTDIVSDLNTLATTDIVSDLNTLATSDIVSDINTLATSDIVTDLNLLATSDFVSDLNTLATSANVTAITNVSDDIANVNTVATNLSSINNFEARYRVASSDPGSSNDAGDLVYNTTSNQLKYFDGSSFNTIVSTDTLVKVSGNDTTSDVLLNKIAGGTLINVVETNNGGNETLTINSTAASTGKAIAMAIVFG